MDKQDIIYSDFLYSENKNVQYHVWVEVYLEDSDEWIQIDPTHEKSLAESRGFIDDDTKYVSVEQY